MRRVDAQLRAVRGAHGNHRVHRVYIEEERNHEHPQRLVLADCTKSGAELCECAADGLTGLTRGSAVVHLLIAGEQRNGERHPPQCGDYERSARACHRGPSKQRRTAENQRDTGDKRNRGANIAPCETMRGHAVHTFIRRDIDQHGIVERERTVQADRGENAHHQENEPAERQRHRTAGDHARQEESGKELHLHALHVGHGSKHRHHHRDDQRRDGLRVPPCRYDIRLAGGLQQRVCVDWHDCGRQHHECGIADIVDDPLLFAGGKFCVGVRHMLWGSLCGHVGRRCGCGRCCAFGHDC